MNKKVLLIEDDKIVRENTAEILELAGYNVKTAANGKNGVSLASTFLPDIIICDILMPVLDGYGVLQIISKNPKLKQVPFIFLTAKTHQDDLRKGMEFGADDYICKPFEESVLLRAIESRMKRVGDFENNKQISPEITGYQTEIFKNIKNFDQFLAHKKVYHYKNGETIYCTGNQSNFIFLIKKGVVKTYKINELGKELITCYYSNDQYFGYLSFVKHVPHYENSKAITSTQLYKINKEEITAIINKNHQVIYNFIDLLAGQLVDCNEKSILMAYGSVRKKTANTILNLLERYPLKSENELIINRSNLASSIGIAKETLIRTLHDFKDEKLIDVTTKSIKVINKKKLLEVQ